MADAQEIEREIEKKAIALDLSLLALFNDDAAREKFIKDSKTLNWREDLPSGRMLRFKHHSSNTFARKFSEELNKYYNSDSTTAAKTLESWHCFDGILWIYDSNKKWIRFGGDDKDVDLKNIEWADIPLKGTTYNTVYFFDPRSEKLRKQSLTKIQGYKIPNPALMKPLKKKQWFSWGHLAEQSYRHGFSTHKPAIPNKLSEILAATNGDGELSQTLRRWDYNKRGFKPTAATAATELGWKNWITEWEEWKDKKIESSDLKKYTNNDAYDEALLRIYQDVERRTLGSMLGSRFHERLQMKAIEKNGTAPMKKEWRADRKTFSSSVFSPILEHQKEGKNKWKYKIGVPDLITYLSSRPIFGFEHFEAKWFEGFFNQIAQNIVAVEYPVHSSKFLWRKKKKTKWRILETRVDAVAKTPNEDTYRIIEYKTSGGSKWLNPVKKAKDSSEGALLQGIINAYLFEENTGLKVRDISILVIERKRRRVYEYTFKYVYDNFKFVIDTFLKSETLLPQDRYEVSDVQWPGPTGSKYSAEGDKGAKEGYIGCLKGHYVEYKRIPFVVQDVLYNGNAIMLRFKEHSISASELNWEPRLFDIVKNCDFYFEHGNVGRETYKNLTRERGAIEELSLVFKAGKVWTVQKDRVDILHRHAIAKQFRYDRKRDLFIWTLDLDEDPPELIEKCIWRLDDENAKQLILAGEHGPCQMRTTGKNKFGIGYLDDDPVAQSKRQILGNPTTQPWSSRIIEGFHAHFCKQMDLTIFKQMFGIYKKKGTKIYRGIPRRNKDSYLGWCFDLNKADNILSFSKLLDILGIPHEFDEIYMCDMFSRNNDSWIEPLRTYDSIITVTRANTAKSASLFACGWKTVVKARFHELLSDGKKTTLQISDWHPDAKRPVIELKEFITLLKTNPDMCTYLQEHKPPKLNMEKIPNKIKPPKSRIPYTANASSGPSYNATHRVGPLKSNLNVEKRRELNKMILNEALEIRNSSACIYFDEHRLQDFVDLVRKHSGTELNSQYDTTLTEFQEEAPTSNQLDSFKLVVLMRSLNRILNTKWKDAYSGSFFHSSNSLVLGDSDAQDNAFAAFQHNSNRNRWNEELLVKSTEILVTIASSLLQIFIQFVNESASSSENGSSESGSSSESSSSSSSESESSTESD